MTDAIGPWSIEERVIDGETRWISLRSRGAHWCWLTPAEAAVIGRMWVERYGAPVEVLGQEGSVA